MALDSGYHAKNLAVFFLSQILTITKEINLFVSTFIPVSNNLLIRFCLNQQSGFTIKFKISKESAEIFDFISKLQLAPKKTFSLLVEWYFLFFYHVASYSRIS